MSLESDIRKLIWERLVKTDSDLLTIVTKEDFPHADEKEFFDALLKLTTFDYKTISQEFRFSSAFSIRDMTSSIDYLLEAPLLEQYIVDTPEDLNKKEGSLIYGLSRALGEDESYEGVKALLRVYAKDYPRETVSMLTRNRSQVSGKSTARLAEEIIPYIENFAEYLLPILKEGKRRGMAKKILEENQRESYTTLVELGEKSAKVLAQYIDEERFGNYVERVLLGIGIPSLKILQKTKPSTSVGKNRCIKIYNKILKKEFNST